MRFLKQWLPAILWAGLILSTSNDQFSASESGGWLQRLFGEVPYVVHVILRKSTHVVGYSIMAALAWRADRRWLAALGITLLVACTDELLQSRTALRTGTPWDVLLDMTAAAIAVFILRRVSGSPAVSS